MSADYAPLPTQPPPFDPEEAARLAATPPASIPDIAGAPPPLVAPPPPTGIDSVDSGAIASQVAGVANPPAPQFPPLTVTAQAPGAPAAQPAMPGVPTPGAPETPKQADELKAANDEAAKAREANDKAQIDLQKAGQPAVDEQKQIREQQVRDMQEADRQRQQLAQKYQAAEDTANKQIAASQAAIKNFKFRDYFSDGEGGTNWALKIGSALSAALGAFGAGLTHGPNYALQILNKNMDDAHQHQLDELGKMKDEEVMQRTGLQDVQSARQKAMADLTVNDAARDKLIAAQLEQAAARKESAQFAPSLTAAAAKLNLEAKEKEAQAKAALVQLNLKLADEGRKKALDEATIKEKGSQSHLADVRATALAHKGAGGGGGGSVALVKMQEAIERQATPAEIAAIGQKYGAKAPEIEHAIADARQARAEDRKTGVDEKLIARNADGTPAGLAPSSRSVLQVNKELKTLPRAIEQLKQLRENNHIYTTQRDPRFHNAVLAVAATTSAGSTDANVAHEKGTLTNVLGLPDNDAIDRKIAELENQLAATQSQLTPLPEGYAAAKGKPTEAPGKTGSEKPQGGAPAAPQAKVTAVRDKNGVIHHFDAAGAKID